MGEGDLATVGGGDEEVSVDGAAGARDGALGFLVAAGGGGDDEEGQKGEF